MSSSVADNPETSLIRIGSTVKDLAKLAEATYSSTEPKYEELGYKKRGDLSTPEVHTFHHDDHRHWVISHRGTFLSSENDKKTQLKADFKILQDKQAGDKLHRDRARDTERIIKTIREKEENSEPIHLSGHSLGGSTIQNSLIKKQYVLDNVKSVHFYDSVVVFEKNDGIVFPENSVR